ncbi:hypothetical protein ACEPAF_5706 [Sanghuangporus sanghuang]
MNADRRQNRPSRSAQDSPARPGQNSLEAENTSAPTWSTEHGGAGAMLLSNPSRFAPSSGAALLSEEVDRQIPCSVLWPGTASSSPEETGFERSLLSSAPSASPSPAAYAECFFMGNDNMTIDPRNLMINVPSAQALFHNQPERENRNLVPSIGTVVGDGAMTPISPIRRRLETLVLPEAPFTDAAPPSTAGTSHSGQPAAQESAFNTVDGPYQGSMEEYQQHYLGTRPRIPPDSDLYGTTPDLFSSSDVTDQRMLGGHSTSESLAGPSGLVVIEERTTHRMNEPMAGSSSSAGPQVPYDSTAAALRSSNFSQMSRNRLHPIAPRPASFVQSTGHGPVIHSYEPEFAGARSQHAQSNAGFLGAASDPVAVGPGSQYIEQERPNDKGKGRLVLHDEKSQPSLPGKESSSSSRKKGEGVIRRIARGLGRTIQRARPTRPRDIECPFCGDTFSNHMNITREHVNSCRSPGVQAIRDYRASGNRDGMEPPARIRCPNCSDRREFATTDRWADHLCQVHGEWITYECDEEGCNERFRTVKERNAHKKGEHKVRSLFLW